MIFNQFEFLFIFLPAVLAIFYAPGSRWFRPYILVGASFLFYGLSGIEHAVVLFAGIIWVYALTRSDRIVGNGIRLAFAIIPPLAALFYYKYLGFFIRQVIGVGGLLVDGKFNLFTNIILPAGISFFTFQLVSFAVDRFRGVVNRVPPLRNFLLYISFFPQLVAGPILRFYDVEMALERLRSYSPTLSDASRALGYICLGLAVKVLVADSLSNYQAPLVADPGSLSITAGAWVVGAYSFQIYFDFYGYSMIAIGLGQLFGFHLPQNFNRPYDALNVKDFWRRWHMTLSYWIRDYLYLPLGGNQRYVRNIFIIFAVAGLWHGAGWTFIAWGLYHAVLVGGYHLTARWWDRAPRIAQWLVTFTLVSVGWLFFLFDFQELGIFLSGIFANTTPKIPDPSLEMWAAVAVAGAVCFGVRFERIAEIVRPGPVRSWAVTTAFAMLFVTTIMFLDRSVTFIYFRF